MNQKVIDTVYFVETPESVDLEAQLAGPIPRILAYAIDLLIRSTVIALASIGLLFFGRTGNGLLLALLFLLEWFYPVYFEVYRQGQTPGKRRLNLVVVNDDLTPIGWGASMIRNLLRAADFLPGAYLFGLASICISSRFQRLGDIAAGSIVVHQPVVRQIGDLPDATPVIPPIGLELEEQVALIDFTRRHNQLTISRQQELADILKEITKKTAPEGVKYIQGVGIWLLGGK